MANRRISELQEQAGLSLAENDLLTVVDVDVADPALKNKKLTISGTKAYLNVYYMPTSGGTISGSIIVQNNITSSGTISGATVTGVNAKFTNITGTKIVGTNEVSGVTVTGNLEPEADNTRDLGSSTKRWANVYVGDMQLSNEGAANDVDGTWGSYTLQEGADDLFLINNRTGKKYKFKIAEVN